MSEWTDRQLLPNNILDRMQALEGRVKDLERMAVRAGRGPGQVAYYEEDGALRPDGGLIVGTDVKIEAGYRLLSEGAAFMGAVGMLMMFPGLVGLWPGGVLGSVSGATPQAMTDLSGHGLHLTRSGSTVVRWFEGTPMLSYMGYDGSSAYHNHADSAIFDISGTEAAVLSTMRGLTMGGWFYNVTDGPAAQEYVIGKYYTSGNQRSYLLLRNPANSWQFLVSADGSSIVFAPTVSAPVDTWQHVVCRYEPSSAVRLFINGKEASVELSSVPASLFNSTSQFFIGANSNAGTNFWNGRASLPFLCAAAVPDVMIEAFYEQSKRLFE